MILSSWKWNNTTHHNKITLIIQSFSFPKLHFTYTYCFKTITNSSENKCYICQENLFPTFTYNGKVNWLLNWTTEYRFVLVKYSFYSTTVDKSEGYIVSPLYLLPAHKNIPSLLPSSLIKIAVCVPMVRAAAPWRPSVKVIQSVLLWRYLWTINHRLQR